MFEPSSYFLIPAGLIALAAPLLLRLTKASRAQQLLPSPNTPAMPHTIVILGGGPTAIPLAHHLLKHTPTSAVDLRVVVVSPNSDVFWSFATVRGILPDQLSDDKLFYPIAPAFARYGSRFRHVLGAAARLDPDAREVVVSLTGGSDKGQEEVVKYDTLVIATGSSANHEMPFKSHSSTPETKAILHEWQAAVRNAKDIVVAGAGMTGVELAGELGQEYALTGQKSITLIADSDLPFSAEIKPEVRRAAARELAKTGVKLLPKTRVVSSSPADGNPKGKTTLSLRGRDGKTSTLKTDLYIPALGVRANTAFVPPSLLAADGRVAVRATLQTAAHADIFAVGDVSDIEPPQGVRADNQVRFLAPALQTYLAHAAAGKGKGAAAVQLPEYKPNPAVMMGVTIGKKRGTGQMGNWKLFGFLISYMKGRFLGTNYAQQIVDGERTLTLQKGW